MAKIKSIEYFRVLPRWLFVKIVDEEGHYGWGESTLEGHTEAVEGTLNAMCKRFVGYEAEYVFKPQPPAPHAPPSNSAQPILPALIRLPRQ